MRITVKINDELHLCKADVVGGQEPWSTKGSDEGRWQNFRKSTQGFYGQGRDSSRPLCMKFWDMMGSF